MLNLLVRPKLLPKYNVLLFSETVLGAWTSGMTRTPPKTVSVLDCPTVQWHLNFLELLNVDFDRQFRGF